MSGSLKANVHTNLLLIQTSYRAPDMFKISNSTHSSAFDYEELAHDDKELWLIRLPHNVSTLFYFLCLVWHRWDVLICGRNQVLVMLFTTSSFALGKKNTLKCAGDLVISMGGIDGLAYRDHGRFR